MRQLTAESLKNALWETLNKVKDGEMESGQADAVASQAREILRTVKVQLQVAKESNRNVPLEIVDFAEQKSANPPREQIAVSTRLAADQPADQGRRRKQVPVVRGGKRQASS